MYTNKITMPEWMVKNNTPEEIERWINAGRTEKVSLLKQAPEEGPYGIIVIDEEGMPGIFMMDVSLDTAKMIIKEMQELEPEMVFEMFEVISEEEMDSLD